MIGNTETHLIVDSQDLTCQICLFPFGLEENLPMTTNCGHTFCSACIRQLRKCAICQRQFDTRQTFSKSILISSLLERNSQVKKCTIHQKLFEGFCLEKKKFICFGCLADKKAVISLQDLEEKVYQLRRTTQETKETYKTQVEDFLKTEQENFKRRIDTIFSQEVCYAPMLKERLYKEIQGFTIGFERIYNRSALLEKIRQIEIMLEKWRRNNQQDNELAKEIIETKLDQGCYMENFEKKRGELRRELIEKQNKLLGEIQNNQILIKCLSKKLQRVFTRPPYMLLGFIPVDIELQYVVEICKELNLVAMQNSHREILVLKDCTIPNLRVKFNPIFFDCQLNVLGIGCLYSLNFRPVLTIFDQILENMPNLQSCTFTLFKLSELEFGLVSNLLEKLKNLKEFSIRINGLNKARPSLGKLRDYLRSQVCFSRFDVELESSFFYETLRVKLED